MNWSGRRVLVTGAGGFIGSHLVERLVELGADTQALVHYNAAGSRGWLDDSPCVGDIDCIVGDVNDRDLVRAAVDKADTVFHLAALISVPYSYQAPESYLRTNAMGTLNMLEAARDAEVNRFVLASSSEVYGTAQRVPIDETHPLVAQSPYAASKIAADKIAEAYYRSYGTPVVTVRPFNTFGPRQSERAAIPSIAAQSLSGTANVRVGNLEPSRDFTFVADIVDGYISAATSDAAIGLTINLGTGREISIGDLVRLIADITGTSIELELDPERVRNAESEVDRLCADNSLARELLGWTPKTSLEDGLEQTVAWLSENLEHCRPGTYAR